MDNANLAAAWLSFAATAVGLGGLISQASAINEQLDPFHANRTVEYLGIWFQRQARFPWWKIAKPPPLGPVIAAKMAEGFCGFNDLYITRIPVAPPGKAGWSTVLAMFNHEPPVLGPLGADVGAVEKGGNVVTSVASVAPTGSVNGNGAPRSANWAHLERTALTRHQSHACITISRTTLITMLVVTNGRPVFQYSDATGFRAGYASYCGQWYITWPIGQEAIIKFASHDSIGSTEVLPRSFRQRVDRCGQMVSGVVSSPTSSFAVAFGGRRPAGDYVLEHAVKGFQGAHSGRHLYNMMGGRAFEVDYLVARPESTTPTPSPSTRFLDLPSKEDGKPTVRLRIPPHEEEVLKQALDCLPWTSLSWSLHRGMRDVLLAYGKGVMDMHRDNLAELLRRTVEERPDVFRLRGWDPEFVRNNMGHMAASAVLAGRGNSGDSVRVVSDIVEAYVGDWDVAKLDEVNFWRRERKNSEEEEELDVQAVVALTKFFVLEWSQEFDYQLYHHLPIELFFG
ncbi:uncharacterized protein F4822DRAFT_427904 [Hypoxylon trugodes]|uniref:uncharacterized protein n=1 Tax=Hypoxylon trugodes TaxID=326681 RepID=UPI002199173F|nr:uncharacterized protein F4822DRAFT_427904 [Hypoxylon trugodes]KAI1389559.1 hypothetical protein F4822DRAFT_427904 [Hypoxylon trugodes]